MGAHRPIAPCAPHRPMRTIPCARRHAQVVLRGNSLIINDDWKKRMEKNKGGGGTPSEPGALGVGGADRSVLGSWVVCGALSTLSLFLTASRMVLPQDPSTDLRARQGQRAPPIPHRHAVARARGRGGLLLGTSSMRRRGGLVS